MREKRNHNLIETKLSEQMSPLLSFERNLVIAEGIHSYPNRK